MLWCSKSYSKIVLYQLLNSMITGSIFRVQQVLVVLFGRILTQPTGLIIEIVLSERGLVGRGSMEASNQEQTKVVF